MSAARTAATASSVIPGLADRHSIQIRAGEGALRPCGVYGSLLELYQCPTQLIGEEAVKISRRRILRAGVVSVLFPASARSAPQWPERSIRIVVGFAPGGQTDIFARTYGEFIGKQTGVSVVIENKTGALGALAASEVSRAPADGHTLLFNTSGAMTVNRVLIKIWLTTPTSILLAQNRIGFGHECRWSHASQIRHLRSPVRVHAYVGIRRASRNGF